MNRPRLFLSAVSEEFSTARKKVAGILDSLGYEVISQEKFRTGPGELRNWLREQIDSCKGLIQLVGFAYGEEPPEVDTDFGRVSYSQFEFLYAYNHTQDIKTWVIFVEGNCYRDKLIDQLDLPHETSYPDPGGWQAERRKLQKGYKDRLRKENHLRHYAKSDEDLELKIHKLPDYLLELRKDHEKWLESDKDFKTHTTRRLDEISEAARLTTEKIRDHLIETAEKTYQREQSESEIPTDWKERQRLREAAKNAHTARLFRIKDLAAAFAEIEGRESATSVFKEMTRIVSEQGVDEAIAYVATQRPKIIESVLARSATLHERNRADLQPLLLTAGMHETKAQFTEAYNLYNEILDIETDWIRPRNNLAWTLIQWSAILGSEAGKDKLKEAVDICLETIELSSIEKQDEDWAETQYYMGRAFRELGIRSGGEAGAELLGQAVTTFREALTVRTRESLPQDWAETQNNLGNALADQGMLKGGEAGAELLGQAVTTYREALTVRTRESWPKQWAVTQYNLGTALSDQGMLKGGEAVAELLDQAVTTFREALTVWTRESLPQDWAKTQKKLGVALSKHGILKGGEAGAELLGQAVTSFREALTVYTRENWAQDWAETQNNLGYALARQGMLKGGEAGAELLGQAVKAFREALTVRTRESLPQDWAGTQNNLGNALKEQGMLKGGEAGAELLGQAMAAYREALTVRTRDSLPQDWAMTQNNLGSALKEQGIRKKSFETLNEAKTAIQEVYSFFEDTKYVQYNQYFEEKLEEIEKALRSYRI